MTSLLLLALPQHRHHHHPSVCFKVARGQTHFRVGPLSVLFKGRARQHQPNASALQAFSSPSGKSSLNARLTCGEYTVVGVCVCVCVCARARRCVRSIHQYEYDARLALAKTSPANMPRR